jgi:hypothetical protein
MAEEAGSGADKDQNAGAGGGAGAGDGAGDGKPVHPAELRKALDKAKAAEAETAKYKEQAVELARLKREIQQKQDSELPELDRLRKQAAEAEALKAENEKHSSMLNGIRDELREQLPEEARKHLGEDFAKLPLSVQIQQLKAMGVLAKTTQPPRQAAGERGAPAPGNRTIALTGRETPEELDQLGLSTDELGAAARQLGYRTGGANPYRKAPKAK